MFLTLSCHQLTLKFGSMHVKMRIRPYFCINILIDSRYIVSTIPRFAMYFHMPEKGLEFQIDFHSHKF